MSPGSSSVQQLYGASRLPGRVTTISACMHTCSVSNEHPFLACVAMYFLEILSIHEAEGSVLLEGLVATHV